MICGNAAAGYCICPVCGQRHADSMLPIAIMRAAIGDEGFMGWALCPKHEALALDGYIALIEVREAPEADTYYEQLEVAERTGQVMYVHRERWAALFADRPQPTHPMLMAEPGPMADLRARERRSLH